MKKLHTLFFILIIFSMQFGYGQACGPCDIDYGYVVPNVYPDTLPPAIAGEYYESDITFVFPLDTTVDVVGTLTFLNFHIMEPVGMPYGMNVSTNLGDFPVDYDPAVSLYGCAKVCGTPLVAGWYVVTVPLVATLESPGGDQSAEYNLYIEVLPPVPGAGGIIPSTTFGCEPLNVNFETSVHSFGADGFSYTWDFGNGEISTSEFPPTQTYVAVGGVPTDYIIEHTITIDTIGYSLDYVTVVASGCDDCTIFGCTGLVETEKPDFYIKIDALGLNTEPGISNTPPPVTFSLGIELDPMAAYSLQVKDDDGGFAGSDDNCGTFDFNGDDVGIFTVESGSHSVEIGISHPVISYIFYDTITVYPFVAVPDITVDGETIFCTGDSTILSTEYITGIEYQWIKDGDEIPGADSSSYVVYETGVYKLSATGYGGCNATSDSTAIEVFEMPAAPNIYTIGNTLNTSSTWDIQWYFEGDPIPGATENVYTPAIEGTYSVSATNGPCVAFSTELEFIFQSVEDVTFISNLSVFPNPNNGTFNYCFTITDNQDVQVVLVNLLGEEITTINHLHVSGTISNTISLEQQTEGIYFLQVKGEKFNRMVKVVVG